MEMIYGCVDFFLHLDKSLGVILERYDTWTYLILFLVVFCETGLVVMPLLPGDSLLFTAGAFAATGTLNLWGLFWLFSVAGILGDTVNYWIGNRLGPQVFNEERRFLKKEYLDRAQHFYEKYGGKTIVLARFVPIVRTFAPFVAGVGRMDYNRFLLYNVLGGFLWTTLCLFAGFWFGNLPIVQNNFSLVLMAIIGISILPIVLESLLKKR
jgi:membrane-associated protein